MQQSGRLVSDCEGTKTGEIRKNTSASVSSLFGSCLAFFKSAVLRGMDGSYTVEASLVMSITLFFIAALLSGIFTVHRRVVGAFALQEALERCVFLEQQEKEEVMRIEEEQEICLRDFFGCSQAELQITGNGTKKKGQVQCGVCTEIEVKEYEPETTLRLWAVLQTGFQKE